MWLLLAFMSAALLGFYDSFKKKALGGNAVIPVLFLNTLFSSLIFLPFVVLSMHTSFLDGSIFHVGSGGWEMHKFILLKSCIVLSSWVFGYFGMKHLPLTIVGPINATRPVMVLVGAFLVFGERLNVWQWVGVLLAVASFFMLSRSGRKEGIDFRHDHWIWMIVAAAVVRQVPHGFARGWRCGARQDDGSELVQHISVFHDGCDALGVVVAPSPCLHSFPLGLGHHPCQSVPVYGRFRIFLFAQSVRGNDKHCVDDTPRQRGGEFPVRCRSFS